MTAQPSASDTGKTGHRKGTPAKCCWMQVALTTCSCKILSSPGRLVEVTTRGQSSTRQNETWLGIMESWRKRSWEVEKTLKTGLFMHCLLFFWVCFPFKSAILVIFPSNCCCGTEETEESHKNTLSHGHNSGSDTGERADRSGLTGHSLQEGDASYHHRMIKTCCRRRCGNMFHFIAFPLSWRTSVTSSRYDMAAVVRQTILMTCQGSYCEDT